MSTRYALAPENALADRLEEAARTSKLSAAELSEQRAHCQAETPLIVLCRLPGPALAETVSKCSEAALWTAGR